MVAVQLIIKKNRWIFILLSMLFIVQFVYFQSHIKHHVSTFYPKDFDQAVYLPFAYALFENIKQHGISALLSSSSILPTGILFPLNALISFKFFHASRFSALLPNFVYFIILQITLFYTAKRLFNKHSFGILLLGCLLSINTPFFIGGLSDFRIDFIAFCLYGMTACAILQSKVFLDRKWSIISASLVILIILMRFITAIYWLSSFFLLMLFFIYRFFFTTSTDEKDDIKKRLINFTISMVLISLLVMPFVLLTKDGLYQYYIVSHLSEIKFRTHLPGTDWIGIINYYPTIIKDIHIGHKGLYAIRLLLICSLLLYIVSNNKTINFSHWKYEIIFLVLTILCPLCVLTLDPALSNVVCGIVVCPILILIVMLSYLLTFPFRTSTLYSLALNVVALVILSQGLLHQFHSYKIHRLTHQQRSDLTLITQCFQDIETYANTHHWSTIRLSIDYVTDYLNPGSINTLAYENHGKFLNLVLQRMGSNQFEPITLPEALSSLKNSNVIILTTGEYPKDAFFPGSQSIADFRPALIQYAENNFDKLGDYRFMGYLRRVYVARL